MTTTTFPTMVGAKMFDTAAKFIRWDNPHFLAGVTSPEQDGFVRMLPAWMRFLPDFEKTPGVEVGAWAAYTLRQLQAIVPPDLHLTLREFKDLGVVSRQIIKSTWSLRGLRNDTEYRPYRTCGDRPAFKLLAQNRGSDAPPAIVGLFDVGGDFQTPTFRIDVAEGGHIYLAQHDRVLSGWALYQAAERMLAAREEHEVRSVVVPKAGVELHTELPWMAGICAPGIRLDFAQMYSHLEMDENGSRDTQEMQGGFTLGGFSLDRVDWKINGPSIYVREVGGQIVSLYHLDVDAYR